MKIQDHVCFDKKSNLKKSFLTLISILLCCGLSLPLLMNKYKGQIFFSLKLRQIILCSFFPYSSYNYTLEEIQILKIIFKLSSTFIL